MKTTEPITARKIETTAHALILVLADRRVEIPWNQCSQRLADATAEERNRAELSPGGYGIHWPLLDEDLAVSGFLHDE